VPQPPTKKIRARKKVEVSSPGPKAGSVILVSPREAEVASPPKRGRRKKIVEPVVERTETEVKEPSSLCDNTLPVLTDLETIVTPTKPKRTRRVGDPKPKRSPAAEPEAGLNS
jgi:hypothetical protein